MPLYLPVPDPIIPADGTQGLRGNLTLLEAGGNILTFEGRLADDLGFLLFPAELRFTDAAFGNQAAAMSAGVLTASGELRVLAGVRIAGVDVQALSYTVVDAHYVALVNAGSGAVVATLPTAVGRRGKIFVFQKSDASANTVTIDGAGTETINGAATLVISTQFHCRTIISDGANWFVIGTFP